MGSTTVMGIHEHDKMLISKGNLKKINFFHEQVELK
jgi:hypothetical protein